ncbi:lysophospholipid acyltransferase family protein [Nitratidesulfovibrio liaohensis]|uniref:Lysophospholipid acyltransferase family protein n=1 Tax=Nitratidesulfovibrio liaohensis TaxID=2604158 RepID=A0ABY9QZW4_9BACT|nr:lysophospholipid acyltransferase family protein [Nitratidesulfovibrio liaohensis]WMW64462.1 lysophospholipid acyltransferase family protein [Nitratidesulfovibrio liaohensis]
MDMLRPRTPADFAPHHHMMDTPPDLVAGLTSAPAPGHPGHPRSLVPDAARRIPAPLRIPLLHLLGVGRIDSMYRAMPQGGTPLDFARLALDVLGVSVRAEAEGFEGVPATGPLIMVANHPFGALEGLVLAKALLPVRPDLRFLANYMLAAVPELRELIFSVDPFGGDGAQRRNMAGLRRAIRHVGEGGALVVFPSGTVSHLQPSRREITDPTWQSTVGRLVRRTGADALPLYFHGRNSMLFNLMGLLHPVARTALLPKELLRKRNTTVTLSVGRPVAAATLSELPDDEARTAYLRMRCYALKPKPRRVLSLPLPLPKSKKGGAVPGAMEAATASGGSASPASPASPVGQVGQIGQSVRRMRPIAAARPLALLEAELAAIPPADVLLREGPWTIVETTADRSPELVREIGRLREVTFRAVGEGSGAPLDLDAFDADYRHLVLWHEGDRALAGAYRLGVVDAILDAQGLRGLYSASLFRFRPEFFDGAPALELGRAFVAADYQRDYAPLLLLWKGIGQFILKRPGVRRLFGPVSVSLDYTPYSLNAIMDYLTRHHGCPGTARLVRGRATPSLRQPGCLRRIEPEGLDWNALCALVRDMEGGRTIPILFKHYLKLGGRIATFHVDRAFGSLDAFLIIDLLESPPRMLQRFMGAEGLDRYYAQTPRGAGEGVPRDAGQAAASGGA